MRNRRRHTADAVERLRVAIDCMPVGTREAMLTGVRGNERVIVGAYVDDRGGVCPMLAAHRCGQRTDFLTFARSWDRFTRAGRESRQATPRELRILVTQLEDSLAQTSGLELDEAIKDHRALRSRTLRSRLERSRTARARTSGSLRSSQPDAADPTGEILARRLIGRFRRAHHDDAADVATREARQPVGARR